MRYSTIGLAALLLIGCGDGTATEPPVEEPQLLVTIVEVSTATWGAPDDRDGYTLLIDETIQKRMASNDSISFELDRDVTRAQSLRLTGVEPNCDVQSPEVRTLPTTAAFVRETFSVVCSGLDSLANKILFDHRGPWHGIYMMGPDGSDQTRLVDGVTPAVSPDGHRIAFCKQGQFAQGEDVWVANADGGGRKQISRMISCFSRPAWSPDGKKIAFAGSPIGAGSVFIYVVNASGIGEPENLGSGLTPDWSPDGLRIAYTGRTQVGFANGPQFELDVWVMDADGANKRNLTKNPDSTQPAWSTDGSSIAFVRGGDICVMDSDGSNQVNITKTPNTVESNPAWSRDGKRLAFANGQEMFGPSLDVWVMNADGSGRANLTQSPDQLDWFPSWSP